MRIDTQRLLLRPFEATDAADLLAYRSGPLPTCFACRRLQGMEAARHEAEALSRDGEYCLAIVCKADGRVIGEIGAHPESTAPGEAPADTFSPCWMLNAAYQGHGYALEAARAFFDYLFRVKGARRIYAYTEMDNHRSQRLCERLGMRREGVFVEFVSFVSNEDGTPRYEDTIQYAILKREWQDR
ncbi:MAG: GNAT family N-acetyltransferase [Clostridia bacterium]|nr:GNAT family N-acetyltransferase [Clostridia bacterium]